MVEDEIHFQLYWTLRSGDQLLVLQCIPARLATVYLHPKHHIIVNTNTIQSSCRLKRCLQDCCYVPN